MRRGAAERKEVRRATDPSLPEKQSSKPRLHAVCRKCGHRHSVPTLTQKRGVPSSDIRCPGCIQNVMIMEGVPEKEFPSSWNPGSGSIRVCTNLGNFKIAPRRSNDEAHISDVQRNVDSYESGGATTDRAVADIQGSNGQLHGLSTPKVLQVGPTAKKRLRSFFRKLGKLLHVKKLHFPGRHQYIPWNLSPIDTDSTDNTVHEEAHLNTSRPDHAAQQADLGRPSAHSIDHGSDSAASTQRVTRCDCTSQCSCRREAQHTNQPEVISMQSRQLLSSRSASSTNTTQTSLVQRSMALDLAGIGGHTYRQPAPDSGQASSSEEYQSYSARRQGERVGSDETQASSTLPSRLQIPAITELPGQEDSSPVLLDRGVTEEPQQL